MSAYLHVADEYTRALSSAKENYYQEILPSLLATNPRKFWQTISGNEKTTLELTQGNTCVPKEKCCVILSSVFSSSFVKTTALSFPDIRAMNFLPMEPILFDCVGIQRIIENMKLPTSPGEDGICATFLHNISIYSSVILCKLFTLSMETHCLPSDWKVGKVVPLPKPNNAHDPTNYRPISLTSLSCKLMEHAIYSHVVTFLEDNFFFSNHQPGFRKSYSCETQLLCFTNDLFLALDGSSIVDCIFLDFAKAFDTVCHQLLLLKLSKLNLDTNIIKWIECFLSDRSQFVTANECNSPSSPVTSGVPQGSVLGPLLFLIYINDLPNNISSNIKLFADDCVIYREIKNPADHLTLQFDLDNVSSWCNTWLMNLNTSKCKIMRVSRRTCDISSDYLLNNSSLSKVTSYKYLGVTIWCWCF